MTVLVLLGIFVVGCVVSGLLVVLALSPSTPDHEAEKAAALQRVSDLEEELRRVKQARSDARTAIDELTAETLRRIREQEK